MEPGRESFCTTRWSRIAAAARWSPGARGSGAEEERGAESAMAELCGAYWRPLYALARKRGLGRDDSADIVQSFFGWMLTRDLLARPDKARGRFRSFLLTAFLNFHANELDRRTAAKRGGHRRVHSLDDEAAELRFQAELAHAETPERCFDRAWALEVLDRALARLAAEQKRAGKERAFAVLRECLAPGGEERSHAEVAEELGTSEGAARVAVHRLRRRYGELLRDEVASTLADEDGIEEELRALLEALGR